VLLKKEADRTLSHSSLSMHKLSDSSQIKASYKSLIRTRGMIVKEVYLVLNKISLRTLTHSLLVLIQGFF